MSVRVKIIHGCEEDVHSGDLRLLSSEYLGIELQELEEGGGEIISVATQPSRYSEDEPRAVDYLVAYRN